MDQDLIQVEMERMSFGSKAVARYTPPVSVTPPSPSALGQKPVVVFVEGGAPGDLAEVRVLSRAKNYWDAEVVRILRPSPQRVDPLCPAFGKCGGCQWQHLSYPAQLQAKRDVVWHQLQRVSGLSATDSSVVTRVFPAPSPWGYRRRVQVRGSRDGLGFFAKGTQNLFTVDNCPVAHPRIQAQWNAWKMRALDDPKLYQRQHRLRGVAPDQFKIEWTVDDDGVVHESLNQHHAALGFSQIHGEQNRVLQDLVKQHVQKTLDRSPLKPSCVLDLFSGGGNLTAFMEATENANVSRVLVEAFPPKREAELWSKILQWEESSESHTSHMTRMGETITHRVHGDVLEVVSSKSFQKSLSIRPPAVVVTDPPREGMGLALSKMIAKCGAETVILVSCDPSTLARDLHCFLENYKMIHVDIIDMFPQTFHVETLVVLERKIISD